MPYVRNLARPLAAAIAAAALVLAPNVGAQTSAGQRVDGE